MHEAEFLTRPRTEVVRRAVASARDMRAVADLLFLETWVAHRTPDLAAALRASQIRRANPDLADEIEQELAGPRRPC
jgi:hypothetical protein